MIWNHSDGDPFLQLSLFLSLSLALPFLSYPLSLPSQPALSQPFFQASSFSIFHFRCLFFFLFFIFSTHLFSLYISCFWLDFPLGNPLMMKLTMTLSQPQLSLTRLVVKKLCKVSSSSGTILMLLMLLLLLLLLFLFFLCSGEIISAPTTSSEIKYIESQLKDRDLKRLKEREKERKKNIIINCS